MADATSPTVVTSIVDKRINHMKEVGTTLNRLTSETKTMKTEISSFGNQSIAEIHFAIFANTLQQQNMTSGRLLGLWREFNHETDMNTLTPNQQKDIDELLEEFGEFLLC